MIKSPLTSFSFNFLRSKGLFRIQKVFENQDVSKLSSSSNALPVAPTAQSGSISLQAPSSQQIQTVVDVKANGIPDNQQSLEQFKLLITKNSLYKIKLRTISKDANNNTMYSPFITTAIPAVSELVYIKNFIFIILWHNCLLFYLIILFYHIL